MHLYYRAQAAVHELKAVVYEVLMTAPPEGLQNAEIGRMLGIYRGHVEHEGHISRTILEILKEEEVAHQDPKSKRWMLRKNLL